MAEQLVHNVGNSDVRFFQSNHQVSVNNRCINGLANSSQVIHSLPPVFIEALLQIGYQLINIVSVIVKDVIEGYISYYFVKLFP